VRSWYWTYNDVYGHVADVGIEAEGFAGVHGGQGYGSRIPEDEMLLEFSKAVSLHCGKHLVQKQ